MNRTKATLTLITVGAIWLTGGAKLISPSAQAAEDGFNACGCRQDAPGICSCAKKSHCGCPGECEPKGCDERREKQMEKEIEVETKKAEDAARRQRPREDDSEGATTDDNSQTGTTAARGGNKPPIPPKVRIIKMTAAQKRDLARLIGLYLAEHPDQSTRAIDQIQADVGRK